MTNYVVEEYSARSQRADRFPRSASDLHTVISETYKRQFGGEIYVSLLSSSEKYKDASYFLGFLVRKSPGETVEIYLNPFQNRASIRLGLLQESFQALLDHKDLRSKNLDVAIENFVAFRRGGSVDSGSGPTYGEIIAEIAAMEALFPYSDRLECKRRAKSENISEAKLTMMAARRYSVPRAWARFYLGDEIMKQLAPFNLRKSKKRESSHK